MKKAEITLKNPLPQDPTKKEEGEKEQTLEDKRNQRKVDHINRQKKELDKKLERLKKILARKIAAKFLYAYDPNDDPQYLWGQIRPTLGRMGLSNICQNSKTQLVIGETEGDNSLYRLVLRRQAQIESDTIDRLRRERNSLKYITWSNDGIIVYVWAPYVAPAAETEEEEEVPAT